MKHLKDEENIMTDVTTLTDVAKSDFIRTGGIASDYFDRGKWASDSTNQHTGNFNRETTRAESQCNRDLFGQALSGINERFEDGTRRDQNARLCDKINEFRVESRDYSIAAERRLDDKIATLTDKVDTEFRRITERELADEKARNIALEAKLDNREQTINNICCPKPAVCVDPCCNGGSGGNGGNDTQIILQSQAQQFQALQQTMTTGLQMIAEAIKTIDCKPGGDKS